MERELKWYTKKCLFNTERGGNGGIEQKKA